MTVLREQVARVVSDVMDTIKVSDVRGDRMARIDLGGCSSFLVNNAIMTTLVGMGYVAFLTMPGGASPDGIPSRLYIDLYRRRTETVS